MRARLLPPGERLLAYPWSSLGWYLAVREHRPAWMRVDRVFGEHGLGKDSPETRREFERRLEGRRKEKVDEAALRSLRRGWCLGSPEFRQQLLERIEGQLGEHHSGTQRQESAAHKAERIIREELQRLGWREQDLEKGSKSDPGKLEMGARLRRETTLTLKQIAARLPLGTSKSANVRLHAWMREKASLSREAPARPQPRDEHR